MAIIDLATEAAKANDYPRKFNKREAKLLQSVQSFVNFRVVAAGTHTTVPDASDPYTNSISVSGVLASDIVMVTVKTAGATPVSILSASAAANAINVRFSADPNNDHVLQYVVFRAA